MIWIAAAAAATSVMAGQGLATVQCRVAAGQSLRDCVVLSETPQGANVGAFALKLAKGFHPPPGDRRIRDGKIVIRMKFKLP
ncbi:MAG: hypothetical protein Q8N10_06845 [Phenylobacterium sp.]|uniref:hypothetical protein n=1 Tax=Phenylobacterium sp. TaxID=1871053 RepID=UPI002718CBDF|nr:hypothetical protein [Phenylobacterium sp.]MDO8912215.1 hypothetical protein [Phenylobacterium sp.]MDP3100200.1 hypothetical protein [Phenylobacterium sp.]HQT54094.1 hypothetical protein [Phenylobacterium sp.]